MNEAVFFSPKVLGVTSSFSNKKMSWGAAVVTNVNRLILLRTPNNTIDKCCLRRCSNPQILFNLSYLGKFQVLQIETRANV